MSLVGWVGALVGDITQPLGSLAVHVKTLGCKVNRADSEAMASALIGQGVRLVAESEASVVVVNTCTVTGEADRKARKAVRHALAGPGAPVVVVTGCLAAVDAHGIEALGDRVIAEPVKEHVAARVAGILGLPRTVASSAPRVGEGFRSRVAVKVEDGCDAFCAYCIVPYARGVPRSVPLSEVLSEVEGLVAAGVSEVVLTGINIGRYASSGMGLGGLVRRVAETGIPRVRLSSIEPLDLTPELLKTLAETKSVCPHLHVPLQSGSDDVLARMDRTYTTAEYLDRITETRVALPGVAVTTDVMAGFPGETATDFDRTLAFVKEAGFARLHVFRYSPRKGTPAAAMCDQVDSATSAQRAALLRAADGRLRDAYAKGRLGGPAEILVERVNTDASLRRVVVGTTGDYLSVRLYDERAEPGDIVCVRLSPMSPDGLIAERV